MSQVFWDAMLFIYLLEGHKTFAPQVRLLLERSYVRGDILMTSYLALAEMVAGLDSGSSATQTVLATVEELGFKLVEFNRQSVEPFRIMRGQFGLRAPDSMHLACAAGARVDLFLTGDKQLLSKRLHIPGIQFIADFQNPPI